MDATAPEAGCDVFFSQYWDAEHEKFDVYFTGKGISEWWSTKEEDWVFMGVSELRKANADNNLPDPQVWGSWGKKLRDELRASDHVLEPVDELYQAWEEYWAKK